MIDYFLLNFKDFEMDEMVSGEFYIKIYALPNELDCIQILEKIQKDLKVLPITISEYNLNHPYKIVFDLLEFIVEFEN